MDFVKLFFALYARRVCFETIHSKKLNTPVGADVRENCFAPFNNSILVISVFFFFGRVLRNLNIRSNEVKKFED